MAGRSLSLKSLTLDLGIEDSRDFLQRSLSFISERLFFAPCLGIELEFSLLPIASKVSDISVLQDSVKSIAQNNGIKIINFLDEVGSNQFEISISHESDLLSLCDKYYQLKGIIKESAKFHGYDVSFSSKGDSKIFNGLHLHLSLYSELERNLLVKESNGSESLVMYYAIAGILRNAKSLCLFCLSDDNDFIRFTEKFSLAKDRLRHEINTTNAPTHISWGSNNRTCLVRIPDSHLSPQDRHIEFRLAVPNCDLYLATSSLILAVYLGLRNKWEPIAKTYGNAFDPQYGLELLPDSFEEAYADYQQNKEFSDLVQRIAKSSNA